jgi:hypothetical protein
VEDVKEVMQFYGVQLVQHLSQIIAIPSDPRDRAVEEIINILKDSKFAHEFIELLKTACQKNEWVSQYIGVDKEGRRDWSVGTNRKVREVRDRLFKGANNDKILILDISPLTLAWRETYTGDDKDASTYTNDGKSDSGSSQESEGKQQQDSKLSDTIDMIDMIDNDKYRIVSNATPTATDSSHINDEPQTSIMSKMSIMSTTEALHSIEESGHDQPTNLQEQSTKEIKNDTYKNVGNGDAYRPQFTTGKEILNVNPVSHVTSAQGGADGTVIDIPGQTSAKERERCKQTSLTGEQINVFYQVFNELENASNLHPGSFSSDDRGTVGREELRSRLVLVGKFTANDADWIIKEMQRIRNIKEVMFDTFRRAV